MKQLMNTVLIVGALSFAACGGGGAAEEQGAHGGHGSHDGHDHSGHSHAEATPGASAGAVKLKDDKLNAVYQHYVHLTSALVDGNAAEAKVAANAIEAGAKDVAGAEKVASASARIVEASDIEKQRAIYSDLSNDFIALVKKSGVSSGELYVDYCPMALDDKGAYWLSANKEIRNPYFGDKMLKCGEIKETLN